MFSTAQLKSRIRHTAHQEKITAQEVYQSYFIERFLFRLSRSSYRKHFILKGGVLVSAMIGISSRTTMDLDALIDGIQLQEQTLLLMLNSILSIECDDGIVFVVDGWEPIRSDDDYGGYRYRIIGKLELMRVPFNIDLSTGDPVTPSPIKFTYPTLFSDLPFSVQAYPLATLMAEKLHAILERNGAKGRMKDYYDVVTLANHDATLLKPNELQEAILFTFASRRSMEVWHRRLDILGRIRTSDDLKRRWKDYSSKHDYSRSLSFNDVVQKLIDLATHLSEIHEL
jgi:predicted nucleotidyltransferase component of viral defense system